MNKVKALILTGYGLNCDYETAYAFELAGAVSRRVHINALINGSVKLEDFQIMVFGGGFSWGDDHGAGVVQAVRMRMNLGERIVEFIENGNLVIGICNGFQTLVNLGLLPGFDHDYKTRSVALTYNDCGNFRDDWVNLKTNARSQCIFTRGIDRIELPVRHGEGKFYADEPTLMRLMDNHQVVLRYADSDGEFAGLRFPFNPNGSVHDISGICDSTGRVFGLMPHPEAFNHPSNHPNWFFKREKAARSGETFTGKATTGIQMFRNAVDFFS